MAHIMIFVNAIIGRTSVGPLIQHMWEQEKEHKAKFEDLINKYRVRPTALVPVWNIAGFVLGAGVWPFQQIKWNIFICQVLMKDEQTFQYLYHSSKFTYFCVICKFYCTSSFLSPSLNPCRICSAWSKSCHGLHCGSGVSYSWSL